MQARIDSLISRVCSVSYELTRSTFSKGSSIQSHCMAALNKSDHEITFVIDMGKPTFKLG